MRRPFIRHRLFPRLFSFIITAAVFICQFAVVALADEGTAFASTYQSEIMEIWRMCTNIAAPMATVAVAFIGLKCLIGTNEDLNKGSQQIKWILIAIGCIYMIPLVVNVAISVMNGSGIQAWSPSSLTASP